MEPSMCPALHAEIAWFPMPSVQLLGVAGAEMPSMQCCLDLLGPNTASMHCCWAMLGSPCQAWELLAWSCQACSATGTDEKARKQMEKRSDCHCSDRLWEISQQERARSNRLASSSQDSDLGSSRGASKMQWDASLFGPTGLLPGQSHTPTRIGRDLHELVMEAAPSQDMPGLCN